MTAMSDQELLDRAKRAARGIALPDDRFDDLLRRRDRKRRNQRIAAGVVGIAVFVAAVWFVTTGGPFTRTQQPAVQPTPTPPAGTGLETYLIDLDTGEMTPLPKSIAPAGEYSVSPDGTMVAYPAGGQVFIASLDGTDVQQVTHYRRGAGMLDWSPDGEAIAFSRISGQGDVADIFVLDLATGETSQVTNTKPTTDCCGLPGAVFPQFSPDGATIVYEVVRVDGSSVRIVPVAGGKSGLLVGGGKNDVEASVPTFSPDGSTLAMVCSGRLEGICIADADGTNLSALVSGPELSFPKWSPDGTRIAYTDQANSTDVKVFVVNVATGETTFVAEGFADDWLDDHTLIVEPPA
jgi:Tol biopolymer transport system component